MENQIVLQVLVWLSCYGFAHVDAWDHEGHERIGHITRHMLGKEGKRRIENMLKDGSGKWSNLLGIAAWEEYTLKNYPPTAKLHYHKQMPEWGCTGRSGMDRPGSTDGTLYCNDASASFNSLFCAMTHFWELIEKQGAPSNLTAKVMLKHGTLNVLYDVSNQQDVMSIPAAMRWFIILLANVHQPLHWLRSETTYGRDLKVDFKGNQMSLLEVWESHILTLPDWKNEDWKELRRDYGHLEASWNLTAPSDLLQQWSQEVAKRVCPDIIGLLGEPDESGVHILSSQTVLKWIRMGRELAILAGQRIAHMLEFIHRQVHIRQLIIKKQFAEIDKKMNTTSTTMTYLKEAPTFEPPDLGAIDFQRISDGFKPFEEFAEVHDALNDSALRINPTKDDATYDYQKFQANLPQRRLDTLVASQKDAQKDWEHPEYIHPRVEV